MAKVLCLVVGCQEGRDQQIQGRKISKQVAGASKEEIFLGQDVQIHTVL